MGLQVSKSLEDQTISVGVGSDVELMSFGTKGLIEGLNS